MSIYDINIVDKQGNIVSMNDYKNYVILIVNTAIKCGFAPQYDELVALYEKYKDQNFVILDFPCNQFANQSPGNIDEVVQACNLRFDIHFPQFNLIHVNGNDTSDLYKYLKSETKTKRILWNFEKFLVDQDGNVVKHYNSLKKPKNLDSLILKLLKK